MKRPLLVLATLLLATTAFAVTGTGTPRIGVLRMSDRYAEGAEVAVAKTLQHELRRELAARGFDAFDAATTYDELRRDSLPPAAYFVEVVSSSSANRSNGGASVGVGNVGATVEVVVSNVAAKLRLYDGATLDLVAEYDLQHGNTSVVPTEIGIGGRHLWAAIALPFVQYAQYRQAAHGVARDAAQRIADGRRE